MGYGIIVFFGGVGMVEEIFYLFGILLYLDNVGVLFLLIFIGLWQLVVYFEQIDCFLWLMLGEEVVQYYQIVVDDLVVVVWVMVKGVDKVCNYCLDNKDVFFFNWVFNILFVFQVLFWLIYEVMCLLVIYCECLCYELVVDLCWVFFGIVVGNVKEEGVCVIEQYGLFDIDGEVDIMCLFDELLQVFVVQYCMKLFGGMVYVFCYWVCLV